MSGLGRLTVLLVFLASCGGGSPLGVDGGGGRGGSGGSTGAGGGAGTGGGGSTGAGGGTTDAGNPCSTLPQDYAAALMRAKQCSIATSTACLHSVDGSLQCPGCTTHVNDTTELDAIRAQYTAASCPPTPCPAIACVRVGIPTCQALDGGVNGVCVDVF
jgi:hypothetical protein